MGGGGGGTLNLTRLGPELETGPLPPISTCGCVEARAISSLTVFNAANHSLVPALVPAVTVCGGGSGVINSAGRFAASSKSA
jgi:hypothetical protein